MWTNHLTRRKSRKMDMRMPMRLTTYNQPICFRILLGFAFLMLLDAAEPFTAREDACSLTR